MCGAISVPCETKGCDRYTKEVYCGKCKAKQIIDFYENQPKW